MSDKARNAARRRDKKKRAFGARCDRLCLGWDVFSCEVTNDPAANPNGYHIDRCDECDRLDGASAEMVARLDVYHGRRLMTEEVETALENNQAFWAMPSRS